MVISVPGLGSSGTPIEKVLELARKEGFPCGRFVFPHEPIQQTACRLAQALKDIRQKDPDRPVALVSYSLGGLIARATIEDPSIDPGNVRTLIMLCPPNHGSLLLHLLPWKQLEKILPPSFQAMDALSTAAEEGPSPSVFSARAVQASLTGLAAVWADLRPGSPFLNRLNSRPRNPKVRYTILLGDKAYLDPQVPQWVRKCLVRLSSTDHAGGYNSFWKLLEQLDELVEGRGDGAVSIARGKLQGVQDIHIFHFSHLGVLRADWDGPEGRRAQELILDRLRTCPP